MTICLLEYDLLWATRLKKAFEHLGHQVTVSSDGELKSQVDIAIVNLSATRYDPVVQIAKLKALNVKVIAHAGHKEKPHLQTGADSGADYVATNGELARNPAKVIENLLSGEDR